jgi:peptide-methionine (S)-S-oxide reductase
MPIWIYILLIVFSSCKIDEKKRITLNNNTMKTAIATFAGGCFWCTEAVFEQIKGVTKVTSGYTGGTFKYPTYTEISTGKTGHAEAIQIEFNPLEVSFNDLLYIFFLTHDPTTLNRQGADVGTQYRSEIFYHTDLQKENAQRMIQILEQEKIYKNKIVTVISPATIFYLAENYHQNYYFNNKFQPYCQVVINPKLEKLQKLFKEKLKQ